MLKNIIVTFFAKSTVALTLLLNLIVTSHYLGSAVLGELSLLVLNIAIIHAVTEIYSGPALVYFIPKTSLKWVYRSGLLWIGLCAALMNPVFYVFHIGVNELWPHVLVISFLSALHAFHNVMLLAREKIRIYNFLIFFQPVSMFVFLCANIFVLGLETVYASVIAMYLSFALSVLISGFHVIQTVEQCVITTETRLRDILKNGFINQIGNMAHILSNRYNYYIIGTISIALVGVYASATSLIESIWIISASASPIILTHIANQRDESNNSKITYALAKLCFILSLLAVVCIYLLPNQFFVSVLGSDFIDAKRIMLFLSPGALCLSFSSILSHYYAGLGKQKVMLVANCSGLGLTLACSYFFITRYGLPGACLAASLAYFMQALVLTVVFMKENQYRIGSLFRLRNDLKLLTSPK